MIIIVTSSISLRSIRFFSQIKKNKNRQNKFISLLCFFLLINANKKYYLKYFILCYQEKIKLLEI